jgi:hypothetical protein
MRCPVCGTIITDGFPSASSFAIPASSIAITL